jgi:hypothetical protein
VKTIFNFIVLLIAMAVCSINRAVGKSSFTRRDPCAGANVYSTEYTNAYVTTPPVKNSAAQLGGRIRILRGTYTQVATIGAVGDIIFFGKLPQGATPVPGGKCFFSGGTPGSTLKIGVTGNDTAFCYPTGINAAASVTLDAFAGNASILKNTGTTDLDIIGTVAGAGIAAGQILTLWQPYVMND